MCVSEEVTGGDASDCLVDVHGGDLPRRPETQTASCEDFM